MRTLFLRIFLWFWLVMAVFVALMVASSPYWTRPRIGSDRWQRAAVEMLERHEETVAAILQRGGTEALRSRLEGLGRPGPIRVYLFDEQGNEVYGQRCPRRLQELLVEHQETGPPGVQRARFGLYRISRVIDPGGTRFTAAMVLRPHPLGHDPLDPVDLSLRLLVMVLVVGAVCYWLARQLTSPVSRLRTATRRLTGGDLSARVGGSVGRRRDEIGELARDFDTMAERVEGLIHSQQRLLRDVSHELRSPLARLTVALELARQRAGSGAAEDLARIEREAGRLNGMISQLLTLTRLETSSGEREEMETLDLVELVRSIVADAAYEARTRNCTVRLEAPAGCTFAGIPDLLRSAVENVVRNAVRYTAEGSEVLVQLKETAAADGDRQVLVLVRDQGPGVPEPELKHLFRPFFRLADARERSTGGSGLGLAITEQAIRWHGGAISAVNDERGGLVVELRLPLRRLPAGK